MLPEFVYRPDDVKHRYPISNRVGQRFGRWEVISLSDEVGSGKNKVVYWICRCDCGKEQAVAANGLTAGYTTSCGCYHREILKSNKRPRTEQSASRRRLARYKYGAKKRGLTWGLTDSEFMDLIYKSCHYCGAPPTSRQHDYDGTLFDGVEFGGIDRIDSTKGYTTDNCVPSCGACNRAKFTSSSEDFLEWAGHLVAFQATKDPEKWQKLFQNLLNNSGQPKAFPTSTFTDSSPETTSARVC